MDNLLFQHNHSAYYLVLADCSRDCISILASILKAKPVSFKSLENKQFVIIKQGSISVWWDKFKGLLKVLNLDKILRIEPLILYTGGNFDTLTHELISIDKLENYFTEPLDTKTHLDIKQESIIQLNSEHCRHNIFNAKTPYGTLFDLIKTTKNNKTIVAYNDNACVLTPQKTLSLENNTLKQSNFANTFKVETHNHPTAIAPYQGAATGVGGEIRDEEATGTGGNTLFGVNAYFVANINFKDKRDFVPNPKKIILDAPIGASDYANEFGRPSIFGIFKTLEYKLYSFHKPIMLAGGVGKILTQNIHKKKLSKGDILILLGTPALKIGLGGAISSSKSLSNIDVNSVQRANPEAERKLEEFLYKVNKLQLIKSINDLGAGGLAVALIELVRKNGAEVFLRNIPVYDSTMNPAQIWINESQERLIIAISPSDFATISNIALQENLHIAYIGKVSNTKKIQIFDSYTQKTILDTDISKLILPTKKKLSFKFKRAYTKDIPSKKVSQKNFHKILSQVLQHPSVGDKSFLIHISDRSISGMVYKDQLVGKFQVPVRDYAIYLDSPLTKGAVAISMSEKVQVAIKNPARASKLALAEIVTNILPSGVKDISDIVLSANWMSSTDTTEELSKLFLAVRSLVNGSKKLGISIPVGKDSLSMKMQYRGKEKKAPVSLILTGIARLNDFTKSIDPDFKYHNSDIFLVSLNKRKPISSSIFEVIVSNNKNINSHKLANFSYKRLLEFFYYIKELMQKNIISSYHDISDGGIISSILEMSFCSHIGTKIETKNLNELFSEPIGAIIEVPKGNLDRFLSIKTKLNIERLGITTKSPYISIYKDGHKVYKNNLAKLHIHWSKFSYKIRSIRDRLDVAKAELKSIYKSYKYYPSTLLTFNPLFTIPLATKPKALILIAEGTNGHREMEFALYSSGFIVDTINIINLDIKQLNSYNMLVFAGGFSYGDVVEAGQVFSSIILHKKEYKTAFKDFFSNKTKLVLGICNGAQILAKLGSIISGAEHFIEFRMNYSKQFESRQVFVKIQDTKSIFFSGMQGSILPIHVAHKEGRILISKIKAQKLIKDGLVPIVYEPDTYPNNPNGSSLGIAGFTNSDGRITAIMPHPERSIFSYQSSIFKTQHPSYNPWFKFFMNARNWFNI